MNKFINSLYSSAPLGVAPSVVKSYTTKKQAPIGAACKTDKSNSNSQTHTFAY